MSATVKLDHPVTVDGVEHTSITIRRPKVRDERDAKRGGGSDGEAEIKLFANLCEVTPEVIEEMDAADFDRLQDAYFDFFPPGSRRRP